MASRRVLFDSADAAELQPDQRQREVAAILAAGVIRMRVRRSATCSSGRTATRMPPISPESGESRLELPRRSSPDGQCG